MQAGSTQKFSLIRHNAAIRQWAREQGLTEFIKEFLDPPGGKHLHRQSAEEQEAIESTAEVVNGLDEALDEDIAWIGSKCDRTKVRDRYEWMAIRLARKQRKEARQARKQKGVDKALKELEKQEKLKKLSAATFEAVQQVTDAAAELERRIKEHRAAKQELMRFLCELRGEIKPVSKRAMRRTIDALKAMPRHPESASMTG